MKPDGDLQETISRNGKTRLQRWLFFSATPNSVPSTALSNAGPARLLWNIAEVNALPCTRIKPLVINTAFSGERDDSWTLSKARWGRDRAFSDASIPRFTSGR